MTTYTITEDDVPALGLTRVAIAPSKSAVVEVLIGTGRALSDSLRRQYAWNDPVVLDAERHRGQVAYVMWLAVREKKGRGIGSEMMHFALDHLRHRRVKTVYVHAVPDRPIYDEKLRRFYRRLGFQQLGFTGPAMKVAL